MYLIEEDLDSKNNHEVRILVKISDVALMKVYSPIYKVCKLARSIDQKTE